MVEEFHNDFIHFVIDCKTGDEMSDRRAEIAIKGYVHMVINALETGMMDELLHKSRALAVELSK